ncbi:MAG: sigma-54-dependent transcriptional regulator [Tenuifilaceae bacterium]
METKNANILIVDDNKSVLESLSLFLKYKFNQVFTVSNPNDIQQMLTSNKIDVILLDMNFSIGVRTGNEGLMLIKQILEIDENAVIVPITAYGDIDLAVKAIKQGAFDFLLKPWDNEKLYSTLQAAYKHRCSKTRIRKLESQNSFLIQDQNKDYSKFIAQSQTMLDIIKTIGKVAKTDANILILGENGCGKELVAREIHRQSERASNIFMSIDLASLNENIFESELFGHVKGAFTDAKEERVGKFEVASGGTLFLDEIGNLSYQMQSKILAALQNRSIFKMGSTKPIALDIRLVCATNKDLDQLIRDNHFREDLLYRINTIQIEIPPLRNRVEDIPLLVNHFRKIYTEKYSKEYLKISNTAMEKLSEYKWPGNIRELKHTIEKAVILSENKILTPDDFVFSSKSQTAFDSNQPISFEEGEKILIERALRKHKGNISYTAKELGVGRQTLYRKIDQYGLN